MELYRSLARVQAGMKLAYQFKDRLHSSATPRFVQHPSRTHSRTSSRDPCISTPHHTELPSAALDNLFGHVTHSLHQLTDVCSLLLQVSLIVPAAPWVRKLSFS